MYALCSVRQTTCTGVPLRVLQDGYWVQGPTDIGGVGEGEMREEGRREAILAQGGVPRVTITAYITVAGGRSAPTAWRGSLISSHPITPHSSTAPDVLCV